MTNNLTSKATLRKLFSLKRKEFFDNLLPEQAKVLNTFYATHILNILKSNNKKLEKPTNPIISGYYPIKNEIDCLQIFQKLFEKQAETKIQLCLPCVEEDVRILKFREYVPGTTKFKIGKYQIPEPDVTSEVLVPNVVIAPLLVFDRKLYRVGYGGGYYDTTIAELSKQRKIVTVGLGFEFQRVEEIPVDQYDFPLDYVLTEKQVYKRDFNN